jgi:hypothetical protein
MSAKRLRDQLQADGDAIAIGDRDVLVDVQNLGDLANARAIEHALSYSWNRRALGGLTNKKVVGVVRLVQQPRDDSGSHFNPLSIAFSSIFHRLR